MPAAARQSGGGRRMIFWAGPLFILVFGGFFTFGTVSSPPAMMIAPQAPAVPIVPVAPQVDNNYFRTERIPVYPPLGPAGTYNQRWPLPDDHDKMSRRSEP